MVAKIVFTAIPNTTAAPSATRLPAPDVYKRQDSKHIVTLLHTSHILRQNEVPWGELQFTFVYNQQGPRRNSTKPIPKKMCIRDRAEVDKALAAITECVKTGKGNLLELAVEASHVRATLGEISDACETIVGRYKAVILSLIHISL